MPRVVRAISVGCLARMVVRRYVHWAGLVDVLLRGFCDELISNVGGKPPVGVAGPGCPGGERGLVTQVERRLSLGAVVLALLVAERPKVRKARLDVVAVSLGCGAAASILVRPTSPSFHFVKNGPIGRCWPGVRCRAASDSPSGPE